MASIDTSNRKPRRTQGTPSFKYRNRFAVAVLAAGASLFGLWYLTPIYRIANEKQLKGLVPPIEEIERKQLFGFPAPRTSKFISDTIEEAKKLHDER